MKKIKERTGIYEISIKERDDGYVARMSFKLGNERNPRVEGFGVSVELAVQNLLYKLEEKLEDSLQKGLITNRINKIVSQKLIKSINDLEVTMPEIMQCVSNLINKINIVNSKITDVLTLQNGVIPYCNQTENIPNLVLNIPISNNTDTNSNRIEEKILFEAFAKEWFKFKLSLCKETPDNPSPLSQKTIDGYHRPLFKKIIPYMEKNKIVYLQQITKELIEDLLKQLNGYDNKRIVYIVFSMLYQYAINNKDYKGENTILKVPKPKKPPKKGKKKKVIVKRANEEKWLDLLEEEYYIEKGTVFNTMWSTIRRDKTRGDDINFLGRYRL